VLTAAERAVSTVRPDLAAGSTHGMDDVDAIPFLVQYASALDLTVTADWLRTYW
jgi:hypothetical protein